MEVLALTGASGTGKSTSALHFAYENNIPAIIDDGLFIYNGKRVAGTSAKFEKTTIAAIKRATFFDEIHTNEVRHAIKSTMINRILLIGTSDRMVRLIAERLQLGKIDKYYKIEDIRTSSEIKIAKYIRKTQGKHIIPIPMKQVEQNFFKKIIQKGIDIFSKKKKIGETTIVQPNFQRGSIIISDKVFESIVRHICFSKSRIAKCYSVDLSLDNLPQLTVHIGISYENLLNILQITQDLQQEIQIYFNQLLEIDLDAIHISVQLYKRREKD